MTFGWIGGSGFGTLGVVGGGSSPAATPAIELVYNGNLLTYDGKTLVYGSAS